MPGDSFSWIPSDSSGLTGFMLRACGCKESPALMPGDSFSWIPSDPNGLTGFMLRNAFRETHS